MGFTPCLCDLGQEECSIAVEMFCTLEKLAKATLGKAHKSCTSSKMPDLAADELTSTAGLHGLVATLSDHAAN